MEVNTMCSNCKKCSHEKVCKYKQDINKIIETLIIMDSIPEFNVIGKCAYFTESKLIRQ